MIYSYTGLLNNGMSMSIISGDKIWKKNKKRFYLLPDLH